jgi:class 3 adenylate cyclase/tetratricopeptide (TPR) repeat protein
MPSLWPGSSAEEIVKVSASDYDWLSFLPCGLLEPRGYSNAAALGMSRGIEVAALFADVSGSTAMSEALARAGPIGTEEFSGIINAVLRPMVEVAHWHGGEVAKFAGDAVTVLFIAEPGRESEVARRALRCAADIQAGVEGEQIHHTRAGTFKVSVSIGLAYGRATITVLGEQERRLEHVVGGRAVALCVRSQQHAGPGEIVAEERLLRLCGVGDRAEPVAMEADANFARASPSLIRSFAEPALLATPRRGDAARLVAPFLHPTVVDAVQAGRDRLLQEHRKVTCLFCRFDHPDPAQPTATRALQDLVTLVMRTVAHFDGYLNRVDMGERGGRLFVIFGAPLAHEDDERRAVGCALELRRLAGLGAARMGVNTGTVFCGLLGSPARREYTVLGDAVNVAARLTEVARPGQVVVGEPTRRRAEGRWSWRGRGKLSVRGRAEPLEVFEPALEPTWGPRTPPPRKLPLVNREAELRTAVSLLERAESGAGQVLAIAGQPGLGKSRLLEEIVRLAAGRGFEVHQGAARSYGGERGYGAWREAWSSILRLTEVARDRATAELPGRLDAVVQGLGERVPLVASFLDLPFVENETTRRLPAEVRTEALHDALLTVLRRRQETVPLLLAVEDGQWLDPPSCELLSRVAAAAAEMRLLLVLTQRTGDSRDDDEREGDDPKEGALRTIRLAGGSVMTLPDLDATATGQLVRLKHAQVRPKAGKPNREFVDAVVARAHGNAFYAEELVTFVAERAEDGVDDPGDAVALPETVHTLIRARLDALHARDRAVLQVASVIGRRFRASWLWGSYPRLGTPEEVKRSLARLSRLEFTPIDSSTGDRAHIFKHALIQEVVYQTLAVATREGLHEAVAKHVERTQDPERRDVLDLLAHHYGQSINVDKQRLYLRKAGDAAKRAYASESAIAYYRRLLPLLDKEERGNVLIDLGEVLQLTGSWREAEELYRDALEIAGGTGHVRALARGRAALGSLLAHTEAYPQAVRLLEQARKDFVAVHERQEVARVLERLAYTCFEQGEYDMAVTRCEEHRKLARELGDRGGESTAIETLGLVLWHRGELEVGRKALEKALALAVAAEHKVNVVHALNDLAGVLVDLGRLAEAAKRLRRAYALADQLGYRRFSSMIVANAAELHRTRGDSEQALACLAQALDRFASLNDVYGTIHATLIIAMVRHESGALEEAERLLDLVIDVARSADNRRYLCDALLEQAHVQLARDRKAEASAHARGAGSLAREISHRRAEFEARLLSAQIGAADGELRAKVAREVEGMLAHAQNDAERASVHYALWQLAPGREDARRTAAELYRDIGIRTGRADARRRYAQLTGRPLPEPAPLPAVIDTHRLPRTPAAELVKHAEDALRRLRRTSAGTSAPGTATGR